MKKINRLLFGSLAALMALIMVGCHWNEDPVRQSLDVDTSDLVLTVGQSVSRPASSESKVSNFVYTSTMPSVAMVDQNGVVTGMSEGEAVIKVHMDETREGWYAAADREYNVTVKRASSEQLRAADKTTPLTLVAAADGMITINFKSGITLSSDITYSINGGVEQTISKSTSGAYDITVKNGDVVQLYSTNTALSSGVTGARGETRAVADGAKYVNIKPSMKTEIYGNLMSLLKGKDGFKSATAIEANYAFYGLFAGADKLVNNLLRHAELPATTLKEGCYEDMFYGCKGLSRAPDLPAETLEKNCYKEMFADCSKLSYVKLLATSTSVEGCTKSWLANAGSGVTTEKKVASVIHLTPGTDDLPTGWTNVMVNPVESITLNTNYLQLGFGTGMEQTATLKATVNPAYATDNKVSWTSSDPTKVTVDQNGVVTAVNNTDGPVKITASAGGKTAVCAVIVTTALATKDLSALGADYQVVTMGEILTGKLANNVKITIPDGFAVVLKDVDINGDGTWTTGDHAGITCLGDALIILSGDNKVKGFEAKYPGIDVPVGKTLVIMGGNLTASSNGYGAGIGGGEGISCGNIVIDYATINATGGIGAAGIGGGSNAACGDITISNDVTQVTAKMGDGGMGAIGKGTGGTCGTVTIGGVNYGDFVNSTIYGYPSLDLSTITGSRCSIYSNMTLTGKLSKNVEIIIGNSATVTLKDVDINSDGALKSGDYAGLNCVEDATIVLQGENKVKGFNEKYPGIFIKKDKTLTIKGDGKLAASSNGRAAGIGGGSNLPCGNIKIEGGTIEAKGGTYSAGIGGGEVSTCGDIDITGGTITAKGGAAGAGIGCGFSTAGSKVCGNITITSNVNRVTATRGSDASCIGRGMGGSVPASLTIGGTTYSDGSVSSNQSDGKTFIYEGTGN